MHIGVACPVCQGPERSFNSSAQRVAARAPGGPSSGGYRAREDHGKVHRIALVTVTEGRYIFHTRSERGARPLTRDEAARQFGARRWSDSSNLVPSTVSRGDRYELGGIVDQPCVG